MAAVRGLVKSAIVLKVFDIVRREAAKPENQAKARELAQRVAQQVQKRRTGRTPEAPLHTPEAPSHTPEASTRTPS
jgi:hypothetical protein